MHYRNIIVLAAVQENKDTENHCCSITREELNKTTLVPADSAPKLVQRFYGQGKKSRVADFCIHVSQTCRVTAVERSRLPKDFPENIQKDSLV